MDWRKEWKALVAIFAVFLGCFYLPVGVARFDNAVREALGLVRWYAREHVVLCLVPSFFIAGAIAVFVGQGAVMRYLGAGARKVVAYGVASVSGSVLAVCSCTVLPLFAGIYRMGAGLGPAVAFLYSGPAINVLAIILTARILGPELGLARAVGAVLASVVVGLVMHWIFRDDEADRQAAAVFDPPPEGGRPAWQTVVYFGSMVGILVFANWGAPQDPGGLWAAVHSAKWALTAGCGVVLAVVLAAWFGLGWWRAAVAVAVPVGLAPFFPGRPLVPFAGAIVALSVVTSTRAGEPAGWFAASWGYAKQVLPLLLFGVLVAGLMLGRPGHEGLVPSRWVELAVGGNSVRANLLASVAGAFMYFATLTEVPILQGLMGAGMGRGPALALLLAGPALSLPNMLVIRSVLGTRKTLVYVALVVVVATVSGMVFGLVPA